MDVKESYQGVLAEVRKKIAGKEDVIELMFISLIADGHVLLEGVPGIAKTTMAKTLSEAVSATFGRVQGTVDLEFKDIIGYTYVDGNQVRIKKGAIFSNLFLIDELNRIPQKVTSSLLEALAEHQVTIGNATLQLEKPFMAIATQNPLSVEGTIPIPKVLADRFIMRIGVTYPTEEEEREMLHLKEEDESEVVIKKVLDTDQIIEMQKMLNKIKVGEDIVGYITHIVDATRHDIHVIMGASPRAEIAFMRCGRARAMIYGRDSVTIDDIKFLARPVLSHRLTVRATGGVGVNGIIDGLIATSGG